jgi:hypothetical protein
MADSLYAVIQLGCDHNIGGAIKSLSDNKRIGKLNSVKYLVYDKRNQ